MTDVPGILPTNRNEAAGSGAVLGAAAGEVLAAGHERIYGFLTQQIVVTAYHLLRNGTVDPVLLGEEFATLAFPQRGIDVYRGTAAWFSAIWTSSRSMGARFFRQSLSLSTCRARRRRVAKTADPPGRHAGSSGPQGGLSAV